MESILLAFQHIQLMLTTSSEWQFKFKWSANLCMAISAIVVSFSVEWAGTPVAFMGFLFGHILWGISAWAMRDRALIWLNFGFLPIDIYAMYIRT